MLSKGRGLEVVGGLGAGAEMIELCASLGISSDLWDVQGMEGTGQAMLA